MHELRVPPQNLEAEQSVLGAIIMDNDTFYEVSEILREEDFYRSAHQKIYKVVHDLNDRGEPVDIITLSEELSNRGEIEEVGGNTGLTTLINTLPTAANARYYAQIVREKAILRNVIRVCTDVVKRSYDIPDNVEEFLDEAEQLIFEIARSQSANQEFQHIKNVLKIVFDNIEKLGEEKKGVTGIPTGFIDFDQITSGLQPSDLIIIAARPSMGKTTLALNMAQHIAVTEKLPVAFFSLEMSKEQLVQRLLCAQAQVDSQLLRSGRYKPADFQKLVNAVGPLSMADFYIDSAPSISVMEMRAKCRRLKSKKALKAVFVDYLQLMRASAGRSENRQQELSDISRALKALAKELNVPVVALSQLSRAVEKRTDRRPILSDLMESGGIEANADLVAFIYREDYYVKEESAKKNTAEIIIAKQRNGPTGQLDLVFLDNFNKFGNISRSHEKRA